MKRSVSRWGKCDPQAMAHNQSRNAIAFAFEDAKTDILKMGELLRIFAYPRRGTEEETLSIYDVANLIQEHFKLEDLEID